MTKLNDTLYPLYEEHVHLLCDGLALHVDGLPQSFSAASLPDFYRVGLCSIYALLERMVPAITCLSVLGIWHAEEDPLVVAFDLWVQTGEEGFYLPMSTAAALFRDNGIPYYHHPFTY
ncbi:MAG: hypothetical protein J5745_00600 [Bacteroidales bacterium]|nr:hypothetical protein [Bacteroidales bacterium]